MNNVVEINLIGNVYEKIEIPENLKVLSPEDSIPDGSVIFRIINSKDGDKRIVWNASFIKEIADAKSMFNELIAQGLVPYKVDPSGDKTPEIMTEFDPFAEEVIMSEDHRSKEVIFTPRKMVAGG